MSLDINTMFSVSDFLKTLVALLAIINPPAIIPIYLSLTDGIDDGTRKKVNRMSSIAVFIVLTVSALAGEIILKIFGISLSSFQIGGGILLGIIAYGMMQAKDLQHSQSDEEAQEAKKKTIIKAESIAVVPLTIPLLTGPGSMSLCVITAAKYHSLVGYVYIILSAILIAYITKITLKSATKIKNVMGTTGMNVMSKVFSLLLLALSIELVTDGLRNMFPNLFH